MYEDIVEELEPYAMTDTEAKILALKFGIDVKDLSDKLDDMAIDLLPD